MSLVLWQPGSGPKRHLAIGYFTAAEDVILAAIPREVCVFVDNDNGLGRFCLAPASGGVDPLEKAVERAQAFGGFELASLTVWGWSAGCQAVRAQLDAGARPDIVLALDGTAGACPPREDQLAPWRDLAARARARECLAVLTSTAQSYVEDLPVGQRYAWDRRVLQLATGLPVDLAQDGPLSEPLEERDGDLVVLSYHSAKIDGAAHIAQQRVALPDLLRRYVAPRWAPPAG